MEELQFVLSEIHSTVQLQSPWIQKTKHIKELFLKQTSEILVSPQTDKLKSGNQEGPHKILSNLDLNRDFVSLND